MDSTKKNAQDNTNKKVERTEFADELNTEAKNSKNNSNANNNK